MSVSLERDGYANQTMDSQNHLPNGGWSAVERMDHVAKVAESYTPKIRAALEDGRRHGKLAAGPFRYGFLARTFLWSLEPPVRVRFKAPGRFCPDPGPMSKKRSTLF